MWFLYFCITAIIVIFSASQLISSIKAINKFPDMNKDVKQKLFISIAFHSIINVVWIIIILAVNAINKNYVAIIIAYLITLPIAFFMSSKVTLNDINNLGSSADNTNNTQSDLKQYEEYAKKYDLENEVTNDAVFNAKRKILSTKFNENFDNIADYTMCHVGNIKCDVFVFVPKETFEQQHILIIKLLTKKYRYFVVDAKAHSLKMPELFEYVFNKNGIQKHNLGSIDIFKNDLGHYAVLEKIETILKQENQFFEAPMTTNNKTKICPQCGSQMLKNKNYCENCGYYESLLENMLNDLQDLDDKKNKN